MPNEIPPKNTNGREDNNRSTPYSEGRLPDNKINTAQNIGHKEAIPGNTEPTSNNIPVSINPINPSHPRISEIPSGTLILLR